MNRQMKKNLAVLLMILCLLACCSGTAFADQTYRATVCELYSVDGYYEDEVGNAMNYSFHVPLIHASSADAEAINAEIVERFGARVEAQFESMERGTSLWCWKTEWQAYWSGNQLFLLIRAEMNGDCFDYAAYGFDFDTGRRVTNKMILEQRGISEEEYLENLREKVTFMFDDTFIPIPEGAKTDLTYEKLLDQTLRWLDMDCPMLINQFGEIETIVKIVTVAGAGWRYALATPFVYG